MFDISFHCNVYSLNYISAAINMFIGSSVWYISSVNTVRKIAVAEASWLMLSNTLLFAELPDLRHPICASSHSRVELAKSEP